MIYDVPDVAVSFDRGKQTELIRVAQHIKIRWQKKPVIRVNGFLIQKSSTQTRIYISVFMVHSFFYDNCQPL